MDKKERTKRLLRDQALKEKKPESWVLPSIPDPNNNPVMVQGYVQECHIDTGFNPLLNSHHGPGPAIMHNQEVVMTVRILFDPSSAALTNLISKLHTPALRTITIL